MNVTGAEGYYNATLDYGDGCTTVTDGKGIHRYYYDPDGNILREEAPDGSTTTYEWDEFHHLLARHSPAGRVEKFEYNAAHGQLSRYTAADGAEWQYRYDERGLLSNITDPAGQTWTQQCDERGLPVSLVSPQGEETRLAYTPQGLLSGIFRQDERRLGIEYDHHNRPETLTDVMGREHHTEYSGHDLPVKMRGPGGQSVRLQWQQHHKLSGIERAGTGAEGFRYDRHGNLLAWTDGNGVVWTMEYGPFDLPVARTDGEGHRWQYRYDKDTLQLTEVINPQGESYLYVLDNCGRVTEEHDWGGVVWRYRYDADGLCTARVNGLEETILYSRDAAGRLAEIITPEGKTQYAYDKSGRLTGIFSPDGTSQRTGYDERGRVNVTTQGRRAIEYHNLINFMANWRALKQVLQHGDPRRVAWDKTTHDFPSVTGDTRSLRPLGQILLENQVITEEQLDTALRNRVEGLRLGGSMLMQGLISAEQLAQALAEQNGVAWESIDAWQIPSSLIAEMPASVALHYAVLPLRLENDELIVGSEDGIDPVSLAALTRKVGRKVRYVIVLRGQIVTGLRHWYARRRGHDPRAMLYNAVQHQWLTEQQTGEIWRQYVPHQFLFAEILTTLGHINRSAINVLLLRHERSSLPLGKFLVTEGVISQETLDRVLTIQRELQVSMQSLLLKAGLNTEQVAQLESENEGE